MSLAAGQPFIRVSPRLFINSLKIIVEHSSMTNQTHLLRQLHVTRPDQGAAPRADNVVLRLRARIDTLTQFNLPD